MKTLKTLKHIALLVGLLLMSFVGEGQNTFVYDFENGEIPSGFNNDATYPWIIVSESDGNLHEGSYCIKSGNKGVTSSTSEISITITYTGNGTISFLGGYYGEGTSGYDWDMCKFYIDDVLQFSYGARQIWENFSTDISAGTHTFKWVYKKDSSVDPVGDAFYIDNIVFNTGCPIPSNVQVAEQSDNYLITWDGTAQSYTVYVYMVKKYENVTENELEVLLYPGENYYVRVESICGESANSSEFQSSGTPLPITLINFTGIPRSKYNHIEWTTATEKNNDYFILESSIDAVHFNEIYRISGAGNSIEALDYDFKDYNPVANITYYRLTQVDYDGSKTTSDIIECKRTSEEKTSKSIKVYPNPAKDEVTIINAEGANILIINQLGQIVLSLENADDNQTINVTNFANGTYFIKAGAETIPFNIVK